MYTCKKLTDDQAGFLLHREQSGALAPSTSRQPLSPYLKPLPAPPVDSEILHLQAQVQCCWA